MHPEALGQWIIDCLDDALKGVAEAEKALPVGARIWADHLNTFGVPWPDWAKDSAYHAAMAATTFQLGVLREVLHFVRDQVAGWGLPTVLRNAANRLEQGLGKKVNDFSSSMRIEDLKGLDSSTWTSDAASSYSSGFQDQEDQVDKLGKMVDALIRVLRDSASSQDSWYLENLVATLGFGLSVAGIVAGIVTAPETLGIGFVVGMVIAVVGAIVGFISMLLTAPASQGRADALKNAMTAAPIGTWPKSACAS